MKRCKRSIAISGVILLSLTGCNKSSKLEYKYSDTVTEVVTESIFVDAKNSAEFISDDLCVVPIGEDVGNDQKITGKSSLLFNISNQSVVYADNIYERIYPASLTKLMTALVVMKYGNLNDIVTVSYEASHIQEQGAKLCGIKEGDQIMLGDLLNALLVYSGNDAGIAIAEHIAGSEEAFCKIMNEEARKIGAVDSHFTNSHGLHNEDHYSTAYDLYLIFQSVLQYDEIKDIISQSKFTMDYLDVEGNDVQDVYYNTNKYLKNEVKAPEDITVMGGKTGTTNAAGNCLEILVDDNQGNLYVAMVLKAENSDSLYKQMNTLLGKIK